MVNYILQGNVGDYALREVFDLEVRFAPSFLNCNLDFAGDPAPRFVLELGLDGVAGTGDESFQLLPGSPCIDAGYVYAGQSAILNGTFDVAGGTRRLDSAITLDTGTTEGPLPIVDIGAREFADAAIDGTLAVWIGIGLFVSSTNWYGGATPPSTCPIARRPVGCDGRRHIGTSITIGELYVTPATGRSPGPTRAAWSLGRPGGRGKDSAPSISQLTRESRVVTPTNLCSATSSWRAAEFGPVDGGGAVSVMPPAW